jgi:hypothetical protein
LKRSTQFGLRPDRLMVRVRHTWLGATVSGWAGLGAVGGWALYDFGNSTWSITVTLYVATRFTVGHDLSDLAYVNAFSLTMLVIPLAVLAV